MTPNVRKQLQEIDHLLDNDYVTIRMNFTETVTVDVNEKPDKKAHRGGKKRNKRQRGRHLQWRKILQF